MNQLVKYCNCNNSKITITTRRVMQLASTEYILTERKRCC